MSVPLSRSRASRSITVSGFSGTLPSQVSGLVLWVRGDLGITLNGSTVSQWSDVSGLGHNLTQATGSKQPTYNAVDAAYNNQPTLSFTAASSQCLASGTVNQTVPCTYVWVGEVTNANGSILDATSGGTHNIYFNAYTRLFSNASSLDNVNGTPYTSKQIGAVVFNTTNNPALIYTNNPYGPEKSGAMTPATAVTWSLGGGNASGDPFLTGKIAEFMCFNRILTSSELAGIYTYLAARYALTTITSNLPVTGESLWLRSDVGTTLNSGNVKTWSDQSGNANHVSQATPSRQPPITTGINNRPKLTFNGSTHCFFNSSANLAVANCTVFLVVQFATATPGAYNMIYSTRDNSGSPGSQGLEVAGTPANKRGINIIGVQTDLADALTTNPEIWHVTNQSGGVWNLGVNGALHAVSPTGGTVSAGTGGTWIGARNQGSLFYGGDLYEVIVYPYLLNQTQINAVNAYLGARYAITVAQPVPPIAGPTMWFRSDLGITLNSSTVSAWADQSSTGYHLAQATGANQPTYSASDAAYNNQPSIHFFGSPQELLSTLATAQVQPLTAYVVGESNTGASQGQFFGEATLNTTGPYWNGTDWAAFAGTSQATTNTTKTIQVYGTSFNGATSAMYINNAGTPAVSGNFGTNAIATNFAVGSSRGANYMIGKIVELLIYPGAHNPSQVGTVLSYLGNRYNVSTTSVPYPPLASPSAWYRADLGLTLDGSSKISQWSDLSGNNNHLTQGTANARPSPIAADSLLGGQASVSFDGVNDTLTNAAISLAQPNTVYAVGYINAFSPSVNLPIFDSAGTRQTLYAAISSGSTAALGAYAGSVKNSTNPVLTQLVPFCIACTFNGSSSNAYLATSSAAVTGLSNFAAGANSLVQLELFTFSGNFTSGALSELLFYPGVHSQAQISTVFQYLAARYNPGAWT